MNIVTDSPTPSIDSIDMSDEVELSQQQKADVCENNSLFDQANTVNQS